MKPRIPIYQLVLHLTLVALSVQLLILAKQNRQLREDVSPRARIEIADAALEAPLPVEELDGRTAELALASATTDRMLLVFTTTCPVCQDNQSAWVNLHERLKDRYEVVGVSLSDRSETSAYVERNSLPFRVVIPVDRPSFAQKLGVSAVPLTLHLGKDGDLKSAWLGLLDDRIVDKLAEV